MPVDFISILKGILVLFMLKYITDCKERNNITYTCTEERMIREKPFGKKEIFRKKKNALPLLLIDL